jgi:murein DD-endopeptidase MepM/ murein hydrolase activator NlpD
VAIIAAVVSACPLPAATRPAVAATTEQRLAELRAVIADARSGIERIQAAHRATGQALAEASQAAARAGAELANARAERASMAAQATQAADELNRLQTEVADRARSLYMTGGVGELALIVGTDDAGQLLDRIGRVEQVARAGNQALPDLIVARRTAEGATARLAAAAARRAAAAGAAGRRAAALRQALALQAAARRALEARIAAYQREANQIEAASRRVTQVLRARARSAPPGPASSSGLRWPVRCPKTSGFGYRWGRMHEGIDLGCPSGTAVAAAASGTVVVAGWVGGYGNFVVIDHGTLATAYGHNSRLAVHRGQQVSTGQIVAYSGSTGHSTGPHVHFEVRVNGVPRNPLNYLP